MNRLPSQKIVFYLLIVLLVAMPYATFLLQVMRYGFALLGHPLSPALIKVTVGWKEILLSLAVLVITIQAIQQKKLPFKLGFLDWFLLGVSVGGTILGYLLSRHLGWTVFGFRYDFSVFWFYFIARSVLLSRDEILRLVRIYMYASIPVLLYGLLQTLVLPMDFMHHFGYVFGSQSVTGNPLPPYHLVSATLLIVRAMSTFPGPNSLAMYAVSIFLLSITVGGYIFRKEVWIGIAVLALACLVATFSRGHLLALITALIMGFGGMRVYNSKMAKRYKRLGLGLLAALLLVGGLASNLFAGNIAVDQTRSSVFTLLLHQDSSKDRRDLAIAAWSSIKQYPFGMGLGSSGLATTNTGGTVFNPESWYIQITQEFGWLGLVVALSLIVLVFYILATIYEDLRDEKDRDFLRFLLMGFTAIVISSNFLPMWFEVSSITWWILFGLFITDYLQTFPRSKIMTRKSLFSGLE
jgi:hypothetical protein